MGMRKFELITITTDLPNDKARVREFLSKNRAVLPKRLAESLKNEGRKSNNYLFTEPSMDKLIEALDPEWEGPQPHTLLVAPGGKTLFRHTGKIEEELLLSTILDHMTTGYEPEKKAKQ